MKKGTKVKVSPENDNECYDSFRDKILIITHVATSTKEHPGYDNAMDGMPLFDLEDAKTKEPIICSLYEHVFLKNNNKFHNKIDKK